MTVLRTWADVQAFGGGPTEAETRLIEACKAGDRCVLGRDRPDTPQPDRIIRAELLRYLILGGCKDCPVDVAGVFLVGAYVPGRLILDFTTAHGGTKLWRCHFEHRIDSEQTRFQTVVLSESLLPGWRAYGAKSNGSVLIRGATITATLDLVGAQVGGQFSCTGSTFDTSEDIVLNAQAVEIKDSVFLENTRATGWFRFNGAKINGQLSCTGAQVTSKGPYALTATDADIAGGVYLHPRTQDGQNTVETPFQSSGEIRLNGATLGGVYAQQTTLTATSTGQTLSLGGATVNGAVRLDGCDSTGELLLAGARISGRLTCERIKLRNDDGHAFNGQAMRVDHSFVWKKVDHRSGGVSLNGAHVAELDDHPDNWPGQEALFLDGFTYDRIKGTVSTSPVRMDWLRDGSYFGDELRPQPYSQYAKFLRDTGHDEDARRVMYTREKLRRASTRTQRRAEGQRFATLINLWTGFWDLLLRLVVGYGHYPFRSVAALAVLICATILPAQMAWDEGSFAPNAAPVIVSQNWTALARTEANPAAVWSGDVVPAGSDQSPAAWKATAPGRDWETFNRYAYGFDVVIPIIDFGQTEAWAPSTNRGPWGWHLWWARWVLSVMGWIVTALGAAAITGIIRRE